MHPLIYAGVTVSSLYYGSKAGTNFMSIISQIGEFMAPRTPMESKPQFAVELQNLWNLMWTMLTELKDQRSQMDTTLWVIIAVVIVSGIAGLWIAMSIVRRVAKRGGKTEFTPEESSRLVQVLSPRAQESRMQKMDQKSGKIMMKQVRGMKLKRWLSLQPASVKRERQEEEMMRPKDRLDEEPEQLSSTLTHRRAETLIELLDSLDQEQRLAVHFPKDTQDTCFRTAPIISTNPFEPIRPSAPRFEDMWDEEPEQNHIDPMQQFFQGLAQAVQQNNNHVTPQARINRELKDSGLDKAELKMLDLEKSEDFDEWVERVESIREQYGVEEDTFTTFVTRKLGNSLTRAVRQNFGRDPMTWEQLREFLQLQCGGGNNIMIQRTKAEKLVQGDLALRPYYIKKWGLINSHVPHLGEMEKVSMVLKGMNKKDFVQMIPAPQGRLALETAIANAEFLATIERPEDKGEAARKKTRVAAIQEDSGNEDLTRERSTSDPDTTAAMIAPVLTAARGFSNRGFRGSRGYRGQILGRGGWRGGCHRCGDPSHFIRDCSKPPPTQDKPAVAGQPEAGFLGGQGYNFQQFYPPFAFPWMPSLNTGLGQQAGQQQWKTEDPRSGAARGRSDAGTAGTEDARKTKIKWSEN